jgi:hypothetical protein
VIGLYTVSPSYGSAYGSSYSDDTVRAKYMPTAVGSTASFNAPSGSQLLNLQAVADYDPAYNEPPVAVADSYTTAAGNDLFVDAPGVLADDTDYEGDSLQVASGSVGPNATTNGSVELYADGSFAYSPDTGFVGTDSFTYVATDGLHTSGTATVTIAVPGPIDLGGLGGGTAELTSTDGRWASGWAETTDDVEQHAIAVDLAADPMQLMDLGTLGGTYADAYAVDGGWVVGESHLAGNLLTHAFAYNLAGRTPSMLDLGTFGGEFSYAFDVDANRAVGEAEDSSGNGHAFLADLSAKRLRLVDLGVLPDGSWSTAYGIEGHWAVGTSGTGGVQHGVAWNLSTNPATAVDLPPYPGDDGAGAFAVSGDWVVGQSWTNIAYHAVAWDLTDSTPAAVLLDNPVGAYTYINDVGGTWAVGQAEGTGYAYQPMVWDLTSAARSAVPLGTDTGVATAVRNGWVVGDTYGQAFAVDLTDASHTVIRLGRLGNYSMASAVAGGWAVGQSEVANGDDHAVAFRIADMVSETADLAVTVSGSGAAHSGKDYTVTVGVTNYGPSNATGVTLVVDGTAYPTFDLAAGAVHAQGVTVTAGAGGKGAALTVRATVSSGVTDADSSNNTGTLSVAIRGRG